MNFLSTEDYEIRIYNKLGWKSFEGEMRIFYLINKGVSLQIHRNNQCDRNMNMYLLKCWMILFQKRMNVQYMIIFIHHKLTMCWYHNQWYLLEKWRLICVIQLNLVYDICHKLMSTKMYLMMCTVRSLDMFENMFLSAFWMNILN